MCKKTSAGTILVCHLKIKFRILVYEAAYNDSYSIKLLSGSSSVVIYKKHFLE